MADLRKVYDSKVNSPHISKDFTSVNLEGGLGNQLFQYAAGLYVSHRLGTNLVLNNSRVMGNRHSGHCITDFILPGVLSIETNSNTPRADNRFLRKLRYNSNFGNPKLKILFEGNSQFKTKFERIKRNRGISGYFQTYEYLKYLECNELSLRSLSLVAPSRKYLKLVEESRKASPIMMHVRRGDYFAHRETFGILSKKYYEAAYLMLANGSPDREIWIFSDDFSRVREEFRGFSRHSQVRFLEETSQMAHAEVLSLMSTGSSYLIGNSTFSWWAAYSSGPKTEVVMPRPWFRNKNVEGSLLLPTWHECDSIWT